MLTTQLNRLEVIQKEAILSCTRGASTKFSHKRRASSVCTSECLSSGKNWRQPSSTRQSRQPAWIQTEMTRWMDDRSKQNHWKLHICWKNQKRQPLAVNCWQPGNPHACCCIPWTWIQRLGYRGRWRGSEATDQAYQLRIRHHCFLPTKLSRGPKIRLGIHSPREWWNYRRGLCAADIITSSMLIEIKISEARKYRNKELGKRAVKVTDSMNTQQKVKK